MMSLGHPGVPLAQICGDALWVGASVLIRTTLILLVGLLLGRALRGAGTAVASLVYRATLVGVVLVGVLSVTVGGSVAPRWRIPLPPDATARQAGQPALPGGAHRNLASVTPSRQTSGGLGARALPATAGDATLEQVTLFEDGAASPTRSEERGSGHPTGRSGWLPVAAVSAWGAGAVLMLAWLASCQLSLLCLRRRSRAITKGEAALLLRVLCTDRGMAPPLLLASEGVRSPFLTGLWRPAILLPSSFEQEFAGPALRAVLTHEVAHLARRDCAWQLLARLACAFGWVQPLLWRLCRRLDQVGEELCDQEVLAQQCPPRVYADCLLALAERLTRSPERALGVGVVPFRSALGRRIQSILDAAGRPATTVSGRLRASVLLGTSSLVVLSLAAVAAPAGTGGAATAPPAAPAAVREPLPAVLRGDAHLDAKATLAHKDRPMEEVLTGLGKEIGVRLVASRETADDKVTLFLDGRPAAEVMALLARHFDFQWQRSHGGYELTQDLASKAREAARRDRERAAQVATALARMGQLAQMANTPRAQLEARASEVDRLLAGAGRTPEERARLLDEEEALQGLLRPGGTAAAAIYRSLTPVQLAQLRSGAEVRLSSADGTLPAPLVEAVKQAAEQPARPGRDGNSEVQRIVAGITTRFGDAGAAPGDAGPPVQEANVSIQISDAALGLRPIARPSGPPRLQLQYTLTSVVGTQNARQMRPVRWSLTLAPVTNQPVVAAAPLNDPALQREVELPLPKPRAGTSTGPAGVAPGAAIRFFGSDASLLSEMPTLGAVGEAIHRATGLEVVADSFVRDRLNTSGLTGRHPLAQILDTIGRELEYDWAKEGNVVRFRSRSYPQDRLAEVPERILRPWSQRVARAGVPSLDDMAELAAALNDSQCRGLQQYWGWYLTKPEIPAPSGIEGFAGNRYHLRFWATLSPGQRREALAGTVLPFDRMNGLQRQAFQSALLAPRENVMGQLGMQRTPTAAEMAAGGFSLRLGQMEQQVRRGTGPDGRQMATVTIGPIGAPGPGGGAGGGFGGIGGGGRVAIPEGITLEPAGAPTTLDSYTFSYHLAGEAAPARLATINLPRPAPPKP